MRRLDRALGLGRVCPEPRDGERQFIALSRSQEIAMGTEAQPQLTEQYGGEVADQIATGYVTEVGQAMAALTEGDYPSLPWEFTLLDSDVINAFALPGGKVFLSRGLAARMRDEAQMAGVIGHEIGHVTARHINDRVVSRCRGSSVHDGPAAPAQLTDSAAERLSERATSSSAPAGRATS
jgi:predicted Zn-dependent protease